MARLPPIDLDALTEDQKSIVADRPSRAHEGPHTIWLRRPELMKMANHMMGWLRRGGVSVPPRLAELTIIIAARAFDAPFAWHSHARQAHEAGISADVIEAIRTRATPIFDNADEAMIYDFTTQLLERRAVTDETYGRVLSMWGEDFLIDLVNLIGCYMMIGANLAAFQVDAPDGSRPLD